MQAGKLDRRVTLQRAGTVDDGFGTVSGAFATLAVRWAAKEDIRDGERGSASGVMAEATTRFRIRWSELVADVNPKDRLVCGGETYDIAGVKEIGRREGLEITATRRADV